MRHRTCLVLLIWMNFFCAPAAAQKQPTGVTYDYDTEHIEAAVMRPEVDGNLLFNGALSPQLEQAKQAWGALLSARGGQTGDLQLAVAAIKGLDPTQKDLPRAVAYVVSWVRLRQGDFAGAAKAMDATLSGWTIKSALSSVRRELLMMHALAGSEVTQVVAALGLGNHEPLTPFLMMLADQYCQAGDQPRRLAALKLAKDGAGYSTLTTIRGLELSTELRLDHPDRVVTLLRAQLAQAAEEIEAQAKAYERLFRDGHDERHRAAASELYSMMLTSPWAADASTNQARVAALATAKPSGPSHLHPRQIMHLHIDEVTGCYRRLLQTDTTLEGELVLHFVVDTSGIVTSATVTATPQRPVSSSRVALGQCIAKQAKTWRFPRSAQITVTQPYVFLWN